VRGSVLVTVGLTTLDVVQRVAELPEPGEKVQSDSVQLAAGGPAANAAVTAAHLGGRARLVTVVGSHPLATVIRDDLERHGVELHDLLPRRGEPPPISAVAVRERDGERSVVSPNAAAIELPRTALAEIGGLVAGAGAVLVDGHLPAAALAAAQVARAAGVPVVLDAGSWKPVLAQLLPLTDVCACSARFTSPAELHECGVPIVIRTNGAEPVTFSAAGRRGSVPVPTVDALDTAGAGDVWHGAFALAVAGLGRVPAPAELPGLIADANAVAARRVQHAGPRGWLQP
jgi:sugar/nucleoside kinase (ribokinase family)